MSEFKWIFGNFDSFFGYEENPPEIDKLIIMLIDKNFAENNDMNRVLIGRYDGCDFIAQSLDVKERNIIKTKRVIAWSYIPEVSDD